jgi:hypothetical protein
MRFHLTPIRQLISRKQTTIADEDAEKKEPLYTAGGNVN